MSKRRGRTNGGDGGDWFSRASDACGELGMATSEMYMRRFAGETNLEAVSEGICSDIAQNLLRVGASAANPVTVMSHLAGVMFGAGNMFLLTQAPLGCENCGRRYPTEKTVRFEGGDIDILCPHCHEWS